MFDRIIRFFVALVLSYAALFITLVVTGSVVVGMIVFVGVFMLVAVRGR